MRATTPSGSGVASPRLRADERHAADGALAGPVGEDARVHRTEVFGVARDGLRRGFEARRAPDELVPVVAQHLPLGHDEERDAEHVGKRRRTAKARQAQRSRRRDAGGAVVLSGVIVGSRGEFGLAVLHLMLPVREPLDIFLAEDPDRVAADDKVADDLLLGGVGQRTATG